MSPTAARLAAVPIGLLAFTGRLLATFWVQPLGWRIEPSVVALLLWLSVVAASLVVPLVLYRNAVAPLRRRPASLRVGTGENRFLVPTSARQAGQQAIVAMWSGGSLVLTERVPDGDRMRVAESPEAIPLSVIGVVLAFAVAALVLLVNRPRVTLEPTGLTIQYLLRRTRISWDDLAPGGPPPPPKASSTNVELYFRNWRPGRPVFENLPIGGLEVEPAFLTTVIRHYVEQPARRAAIGTEAELARLRSAFAA